MIRTEKLHLIYSFVCALCNRESGGRKKKANQKRETNKLKRKWKGVALDQADRET